MRDVADRAWVIGKSFVMWVFYLIALALFICAIPLLIVWFIIDYDRVMRVAESIEPRPGNINWLGRIVIAIGLPLVMLYAMFVVLFRGLPDTEYD